MPRSFLNTRPTHFLLLLGLSLNTSVGMAENIIDLWQHASENNPILKSSEYAVEEARAQQDKALSKLLPQANVKGYYSFNSYNRNVAGGGITLSGGSNQQYGGYMGNMTITQALFDLPSFLRLQGANKLTQQQEQYALYQRMDLAYKLVDEYLAILSAEDQIEDINAELRSTEAKLGRSRQMHSQQLVKVTDLYEVEAYAQTLETTKIEAEHERSIANEKVREITGVPVTSADPLAQDSFPDIHRSADEWVQEALASNPMLLSLQFAAESAQHLINSSQAEHLPTASVSASETISNTITNNLQIQPYNIGSMYLNVTIPIYSGGGIEAGVRESVQKYQISREKIEEARRTIEKDTRSAWLNVKSGYTKIESSKKEVEFRRKAVAAQEANVKIGTSTLIELLDAQKNLSKSRINYHKARYDFVRSLIRLRLNSGSLADMDLEAVSVWFSPSSREKHKGDKTPPHADVENLIQ